MATTLRESGICSRCATDAGDCFAGKADAMIGFRADAELRARIEELAQETTEGELTEDERGEYAGHVRANKFVGILKPQAQQITNFRSQAGQLARDFDSAREGVVEFPESVQLPLALANCH